MNNESDDQIRDILDDIPERSKLAEVVPKIRTGC